MIEPVSAPLGFDWRIGTALVGAIAAKEVFVAQMGIVFAVGEADETSEQLRAQLRQRYSPLIGFCIMLFALISTPCIATFAITRQESGSDQMGLRPDLRADVPGLDRDLRRSSRAACCWAWGVRDGLDPGNGGRWNGRGRGRGLGGPRRLGVPETREFVHPVDLRANVPIASNPEALAELSQKGQLNHLDNCQPGGLTCQELAEALEIETPSPPSKTRTT